MIFFIFYTLCFSLSPQNFFDRLNFFISSPSDPPPSLKDCFENELQFGIDHLLKQYFPFLRSFSFQHVYWTDHINEPLFFNPSFIQDIQLSDQNLTLFIDKNKLDHIQLFSPLHYQAGCSYLILKSFFYFTQNHSSVFSSQDLSSFLNNLNTCSQTDFKEILSVEYECANNFYSHLSAEQLSPYLSLLEQYFFKFSSPHPLFNKYWLSIALGLSKNISLNFHFKDYLPVFYQHLHHPDDISSISRLIPHSFLDHHKEKSLAIEKANHDSADSLSVYPLLLYDALYSIFVHSQSDFDKDTVRKLNHLLFQHTFFVTQHFSFLLKSSLSSQDYQQFLNSLSSLDPDIYFHSSDFIFHFLQKLIQCYLEKRRFFTPDFVFRPESGIIFCYRGKKYALLGNFGSEQSREERGPELIFNQQFYESLGYHCITLKHPFEAGAEVKFLRQRWRASKDTYRLNVIVNHGFRNSQDTFYELKKTLSNILKEEDEKGLLKFHLVRTVRDDFYHLDVALAVIYSPILQEEVLMYYPYAFDDSSQKILKKLSPQSIEVLPRDCYFFSCNSPTIDNLIFMDFRVSSTLKNQLSDLGVHIVPTQVSEFYKAGGGGKCLVCEMHLESLMKPMTRQNTSFLVTADFNNMFTVEYKIESLMGGLPSMTLSQQQHQHMIQTFKNYGIHVTSLTFPPELSPESDKRSLLIAFIEVSDHVPPSYRSLWNHFISFSGGFLSLYPFVLNGDDELEKDFFHPFVNRLDKQEKAFLKECLQNFQQSYLRAYSRSDLPWSPARFHLSQSQPDNKGQLPFQLSFTEVLTFIKTDKNLTFMSLNYSLPPSSSSLLLTQA